MAINALVDYNSSDSEEESSQTSQQTSKLQLKNKTKIFLEPFPTQIQRDTTLVATKAGDILKPPTKRPAKSGLAGLLPPPKRTQLTHHQQQSNQPTVEPPPTPSLDNSSIASTLTSQTSCSSPQSRHASSSTLSLNLFGLPQNITPASLPPNSSQLTNVSITISSAPQVSEETPPEPSLLDPYPGYWQRKDGTWVQRDPEEPKWKEFCLKHYHHNKQDDDRIRDQLPKDFFKDGPDSNLVEFNAKKEAQLAWENKPKILDPRVEARVEQQANSKPAKYASARARGRHQLTCLLTEAQANRAELEDRIARGKFNRKAGGAKYGF